MNDHTIPADLSIPAFLRTTTAGTPHQVTAGGTTALEEKHHGYGESCWQELQRESEVVEAAELRDAVRQYEREKFIAEKQQWAIENPELAAMDAKARRDRERRIARLGVPPARRSR